jgi:hypothetical protein
MNLNLSKKTILNRKTNFLIYSIEKTNTPYVYFYMIKTINNYITLPSIYIKHINDSLAFMEKNFKTLNYKYVGTMDYNDENIVVYEIEQRTHGITPTLYNDTWWNVTPFEVLYSKKVLQFDIDAYYVTFFKLNPQFLFVFNKNIKYEVPIVAYIGIDQSEINNQILMSDLNYKKGHFGKGFYFETLEEAYFKSIYADLSLTEQLVKLINRNYINEKTDLNNRIITIIDNKYYLNNTYIGNVPSNCGSSTFVLHKFNEDFIYIKSDKKMQKCKDTHDYYIKRDTGCIMRYVLFLNNHSLLKRSGYDSYCSLKKAPTWFTTYMIKNFDNVSLLSYHYTEPNNIEQDYITKRDKHTSILIK